MLILGAGMPVSGKSRRGYPHGVDEMRNTNTLTYASVSLP
jgi:hypothetical protein